MAKKINSVKKTDYYSLFVLGGIFFFVGLFINLYGLMALGIVFLISGITNKNQWYENKSSWVNLNSKQKRKLILTLILIFLVTLVLLILIRFFY